MWSGSALSVHFDKFVLEVFVPNNDCHRPPPALRAHGTIRNKCAVSADAAWQVIDQEQSSRPQSLWCHQVQIR